MTLQALREIGPECWEVEQLIVLDWYDGPRSGVCRMRSPRVDLLFEVADERATPDDLDDRLFRLALLPRTAFDNLRDATATAAVDREPEQAVIERAKQEAVPTTLIVYTRDFKTLLGCWDVGSVRDVANWFDFLGI